MPSRRVAPAFALLFGAAQTAWSHSTIPPVDACSLLEQQRRLPAAAPQASESGVLPALPARPVSAEATPSFTRTTARRFDVIGNTLLADAAVQAALSP